MRNFNVICVIGNKFKQFTKHEGVLTFSNFVALIKEKEIICKYIVIGQGLNEEEKNIIKAIAERDSIEVINSNNSTLASSEVTHKVKNENIMISEPVQSEKSNIYIASLSLNDECAEMSDHVTGQHIQGMVLTEAARQMMLAVGEEFILKSYEKGNSYCALVKVASNFIRFAFPIDITIEHEILELTKIQGKGYSVKTRTKFIQANELISYVDIDYKFYNKKLLSDIENVQAEKTYEKTVHLLQSSRSYGLIA